MVLLTSEQITYKEKTLNQLLANLPELEAKWQQESRPEVKTGLEKQIDDTQAHIELLQSELTTGLAQQPVGDELCQRIAQALVKGKYYMARKYLAKLETIEPFYPNLDRLRAEAETERAGRRTQAIAQGTALPYGASSLPPATAAVTEGELPVTTTGAASVSVMPKTKGEGRFSRFFQFHFVASCLVILLILCVMLGVGSISLLQWLIEGG